MSYVRRINYNVGEMVNCIVAQKYTSIHVNVDLLTIDTKAKWHDLNYIDP
jgi:hypothetical protein